MGARTSRISDPAQGNVFDSGTRARSRDPETSKAAAASVKNKRASHERILNMFRLYGDMNDETLTRVIRDAEKAAGLPPMSVSGVRSRRSELSKPNMDRLDEIAREHNERDFAAQSSGAVRDALRGFLRREGFRSELWDTGKRETLASGRQAIVWGIAR